MEKIKSSDLLRYRKGLHLINEERVLIKQIILISLEKINEI